RPTIRSRKIVGNVKVSLLGADAAMQTFTADLKGSFKGQPLPARVFATEILVKRAGNGSRDSIRLRH
ncbi:MAG TPA: hypothetical protein VI075_02430, partial [Methyloceanibacter sp.]